MRLTILLLSAAVAIAAPAAAQSPYPPVRNPYLTVTYGSAGRSQDVHQQGSFAVYNEVLAFDVLHNLESEAFLDVGAGARVWRGLFVGGAFTKRRTETHDVGFETFVPNPAFYDSYRYVQGRLPAIEHRENAFHIQAMWRFDLGRSFQVGLFGGPTLFNVSHDLVENFTVAETGSPFTAVNVTEPTRRRGSEGVFGAHAGVEATIRAIGHVGLGGMVRYSRATATLTAPEVSTMELIVGGLDAGLRVRIGF